MRWGILLGGLVLGYTVCFADPVLNFVYPAGGQAGSEFEVEIGGELAADVTQAVISGEGIKATLQGPVRAVTYTKKGRPVQSVVPNRFRFKVVVEKEAAPGLRALRVCSTYRLSDPVGFEVAALPELSESVTNRAAAGTRTVESLPVCLNGRVHGEAGDRYRFKAVKGMTLVAFTEPGVLPCGGFLPALTVTDAAGRPCEGLTVFNAAAAPVAVFEVPQDGEYVLVVKSDSKAVGDACVYRLKLGELPLVTGFSPSGAKEGESLNVKLAGYNLPQKRVRLFTGGKNSALCLAALTEGSFAIPALRFDLSAEADAAETEPNDTSETAQTVALPGVVNGALAPADGRDVFRFGGQAGDVVCVDVNAASIGSTLRPVVTVRDSRGKVVAKDLFCTNGTVRAALQSRDPSVTVKLVDGGPYEVEVSDAEGRTGGELFYRLRIGPPQPDFKVWMTPASLNIPADGSMLVTVYLQRLHGFDGEVRVALDFPPLSIACEGGVIPPGETSCLMTVSTDGVRFPRTVFGLSLTASAEVGERPVKRTAVPVRFEGVGGHTTARTFSEVSARASAGLRALRLNVAPKTPVTVSVKEPARLMVLSPNLATHLGGLYEPVVISPPCGFTVQGVQHTNKQERAWISLKADSKLLRPGDQGQLIIGCVQRSDASRTVMAVTQSVPFIVK